MHTAVAPNRGKLVLYPRFASGRFFPSHRPPPHFYYEHAMEVHRLRSRMLYALVCLVVATASSTALAAKPVDGAKPAATAKATENLVTAGDPEWIWAPAPIADEPLSPTAWFRKTFEITSVESARIQITCDD